MKKLYMLLLALSLVLTACGDSDKKEEADKKVESQAEKVESEEETKEETKEETEEETKEEESSDKLELNKPIKLGDLTITLKELKLVKDYEDKDALKIVYSWENGSDKKVAPFITIDFTGYQDGVETDDLFMSEDIDLGIGQKDVKPGGKIDNIETGILVDVAKPLELELKESFSLDDKAYTLKIEDLSQYK